MKTFEDLKSQWENQPEIKTPKDGAKLIIKKINFVKKKQRITNIILGVTSIILVFFFFYISAYNNIIVAAALLLMVCSLFIRMGIEYISTNKLNQIKRTVGVVDFKKNLIGYYKKRIKTHYVVTPIIMILYITGFVILLPFFKEHLSRGFFTYIQLSSIIILLALVLFIRKQILKEMLILRDLSS